MSSEVWLAIMQFFLVVCFASCVFGCWSLSPADHFPNIIPLQLLMMSLRRTLYFTVGWDQWKDCTPWIHGMIFQSSKSHGWMDCAQICTWLMVFWEYWMRVHFCHTAHFNLPTNGIKARHDSSTGWGSGKRKRVKDGLTAMQLAFNAGEHHHGGQFGWTHRK